MITDIKYIKYSNGVTITWKFNGTENKIENAHPLTGKEWMDVLLKAQLDSMTPERIVEYKTKLKYIKSKR